ncbi:MAG: DUF47 family protein [Propionibacteriaceae bacterium]|jgi:uncharacterized protein Yka (UPF0111/DUF47 family)|nr:DUF47 family protein [Propionibacteriaceae bacterium]
MAKNDKKKVDYFELLVEMSDYACAAAKLLRDSLRDYENLDMERALVKMHAIEHGSDEKIYALLEHVEAEFITPIQREDILAIAGAVDAITNKTEDALNRMYVHNISAVRPDVLPFVEVAEACTDAVKALLKELHHFKKPKHIRKSCVEISRLEEEGDLLYTRALRALFTEPGADPLAVIGWTKVYDYLEGVCDACQAVADTVLDVVLKNT